MIDDDITFAEKGYRSTDLSCGSGKEVWAVCEGVDCQRKEGRGRWVMFSQYRKLCHSCAMKNLPIERCKTPTEKLPWIDDDITFAEKGYRSTELKSKSAKLVWRVCLGCGEGRWVRFFACRELCHLCAMRTEEFRNNASEMSKSKTGENASRWKGGISNWRDVLWRSQSYKNWRKAVFERDDYTCQMCNVRGGDLEAHHILPIKDNKNTLLIFDIDNGITLCKSCHNETKGKEYEFVGRFQKIVCDIGKCIGNIY